MPSYPTPTASSWLVCKPRRPAHPSYHDPVRPHLASLVDDFLGYATETAIVVHRGNRRYATSYGELAQLAGRFAAELDRRGLVPGDRVLLWGGNSAEWIAAFFGCLLRGVIAVPLDTAGSPAFAQRVLADVSPKLIVASTELLSTLATTLPQLPLNDLAGQLPAAPNLSVSDFVNLDTPFQIIFTSGTTSEPKGIVHTHRNVLASVQPIEDEIAKYRRYERLVHPLRFLHTLPLSHVFGQFMGFWLPPLLAAEVHFLDQPEPRRIAAILPRERISVLVAVPRILELLETHLLTRFPSLAQQLDQANGLPVWKRWWRLRSVHSALGWKFWAVISGGATLPPDLEAFYNRLGLALIQGYGMTETTALVTLNHPFKIGRGTIGKALPGREVRLTHEGEMQVRGDMLASSTWQAGQMRARETDWLSTGDLAAIDPSGELRFLGRKGDVIVTAAGMNIHPADLEAALAQQPGVRACAIVPCQTPSGTEPVAVVLFSGSEEELQAAAQAANLHLAAYQQIRRVLKWPGLDFPYTSTGKLLRRVLTDWACQNLGSQQHSAPTQDSLLQLITSITGESAASDDDRLRLSEDLHLDSLGRVQLQSELEQSLGVDLNDDRLATAQTLGDLRDLFRPEAPTAATNAPPPPSEPAHEAPIHHYPRWPWLWPAHVARILFLELLMRPLVWLLVAPRVTGPQLPLPESPLLLIANHVTAYDGALILYALPGKLRRRVAIAMSGEMFLDLRQGRNQGNTLLNLLAPVGYWLITALFNVFPLPRSRGFRASFDHAGDAMDRGYSILIFPEGTRSRDGLLHPFRSGIGLLAQESQAPILPIALLGLHEMRAARRLRPNHLEVRIGEPIPVDERAKPSDLAASLAARLRDLLR
jgi:long-chain acyl-CoA synthetase